MTTQEFSDQFDLLYNNIASNQAPGLDDYEKSVFLTKAQDEIIKSYFNPKLNKPQEGFDGSERRQIDFSRLIEISLSSEDDWGDPIFIDKEIYKNSISVTYPLNTLLIISEQVKVDRNNTRKLLQVIPISYIEYTRLMSKPFKRPLKNQAWKISGMGVDIDDNPAFTAEIIVGPSDVAANYIIRYIKRPKPIILTALNGVTIGGYVGCNDEGELVTTEATTGSECELDPILHEEILQRAVELAKAAWQGDLISTTQIGSASSTEKGIILQSNNK